MFLVHSPNCKDRVFLVESSADAWASDSSGKVYILSEEDVQLTHLSVAWRVDTIIGPALFTDRGRATNYCTAKHGTLVALYHT